MRYGWISFTTDYGLADPFVGICHGVLARIAPLSRVIDVTHGITAGALRQGAYTLAQAVVYLPQAVHCAVVDPGVGTSRRGIVLVAREGLLVGPDNGLLLPAAEALGGAVAARELTAEAYRLAEVSATFHGRDVFAPAAGYLANGTDPDELGPDAPLAGLEHMPEPAVRVRAGSLTADVLAVDGFGNVQLAAAAARLAEAGLRTGEAIRVEVGGTGHDAVLGRTFADVAPGALVLLRDSSGLAALAVNGGSAAAQLGVAGDGGSHDRTVTLSPIET